MAGTEHGESPGAGPCPAARTERVQPGFAGRRSAAGRGLFLLSRNVSASRPGLAVCHCMIAAQGNTSALLLIAGICLRGVF